MLTLTGWLLLCRCCARACGCVWLPASGWLTLTVAAAVAAVPAAVAGPVAVMVPPGVWTMLTLTGWPLLSLLCLLLCQGLWP